MTFEEMEKTKERARAKNLSFDEQCAQMAKFIQKNNVKTIKKVVKNAKKTSQGN